MKRVLISIGLAVLIIVACAMPVLADSPNTIPSVPNYGDWSGITVSGYGYSGSFTQLPITQPTIINQFNGGVWNTNNYTGNGFNQPYVPITMQQPEIITWK